MLLSFWLACALPNAIQFSVKSGHGLDMSFAGVPVVRGSGFQYYEPDWSRAYYRSAAGVQQITTKPNGDVQLKFSSPDSTAWGNQTYTKTEDGLSVTYQFFWKGDHPIAIELNAGLLWTQPLEQGSLFIDGKPARALGPSGYPDDQIQTREYAENAREYSFDAGVGRIIAKGDQPKWTLYDARGYPQSWARSNSFYWLGMLALPVKPNEMTTVTMEWHFQPRGKLEKKDMVRLGCQPTSVALLPTVKDLPLLPQPKSALLKPETPLVLGQTIGVNVTDSLRSVRNDLANDIKLFWDVPNLALTDQNPSLYCRIQDIGLPPGGYEFNINPQNGIVRGQDEEGLKNAFKTLANLMFVKDGKLCLPAGIIRDWPSISWRGVHLFLGPEALEFHRQLWERVLGPLKMNKVVVQCDYTNWKCLPGLETPKSVSTEDLAKLFAFYRSIDVEPIPLVESWGHMRWLFANGKNLDLAANKEDPLAIDPSKPRAKEVLASLWDEIIGLLHPKTIHFGLDEVDSREAKRNPAQIDQLWAEQIPFLSGIASKYKVNMMMWGDKALAPGEAIDAALGDSPANAKARRSAIPKGTMIADWHYKNDPDPSQFMASLNLWKSEGMLPIACTWFRPENIQGFYRAADRAGCGTLQTTWAGYEMGEDAVMREYRQFAAMVMAADYAWSGRLDMWNKLDYDPAAVFGRMFYSKPSPLTPVNGSFLGAGATITRIGDVNFRLFAPIGLVSIVSPGGSNNPTQLTVETDGFRGREVALALDTTAACEDGDPVANVEIQLANGQTVNKTILYGRHVRTPDDARAVGAGAKTNGVSAVRIELSDTPVTIKSITIDAISTYAGLRLLGATAF